QGYPTMFFVGPDGKMLRKIIGYHDEPILREFFLADMSKYAERNSSGMNDTGNSSQTYTITGLSYVKSAKLGFYPFNDSLTITDGKFEFTGKTDKPILAILAMSPSQRVRIILEPGTINVIHTKDGFRISGTPNNDRLQKFED